MARPREGKAGEVEEEEGMGTGMAAFLVALVILVAAGVVYLRRRGQIETAEMESDEAQSPGPSVNPFSEVTETEELGEEIGVPESSDSLGSASFGDEEQTSSARSFDMSYPDPDYEDDDKPVEPVDEPLIGYSLGQHATKTTGAATEPEYPSSSLQVDAEHIQIRWEDDGTLSPLPPSNCAIKVSRPMPRSAAMKGHCRVVSDIKGGGIGGHFVSSLKRFLSTGFRSWNRLRLVSVGACEKRYLSTS